MQINQEKNTVPFKSAAFMQVYEIHQDLLKTINQMDNKIEEVIKQHEAEFLLAYRNHIQTMKQELTAMKEKSDEQEKKMMSNDRAVFLEKQLILFREEALRLYDKLEEKTQESEMNKSRIKDLEKSLAILEKENKDILKTNKNNQASMILQQNTISELQQQNLILKREVDALRAVSKLITKKQTQQTNIDPSTLEILTPKKQQQAQLLPSNYKFKKNSKQLSINNHKKSRTMSNEWMDHELKNWFLECLQTIRKEVAQRKVYGYRSQDIKSIMSWQEFRMIDKLRLLEMFMQNEKLLVWMYQKIFPTRIADIEAFLSKKDSVFQNREKSKSMNIQLESLPVEQSQPHQTIEDQSHQKALPKLLLSSQTKAKQKKFSIRNRIDIRNGKLKLSQFGSDF